jgi:hypothetical protein
MLKASQLKIDNIYVKKKKLGGGAQIGVVPGKHYTIELHLQPLFFLRQDFTL